MSMTKKIAKSRLNEAENKIFLVFRHGSASRGGKEFISPRLRKKLLDALQIIEDVRVKM